MKKKVSSLPWTYFCLISLFCSRKGSFCSLSFKILNSKTQASWLVGASLATFCCISDTPCRTGYLLSHTDFLHHINPGVQSTYLHTCIDTWNMQHMLHATQTHATCMHLHASAGMLVCTHYWASMRDFPILHASASVAVPMGSRLAVTLTFNQSLWKAYCRPNIGLGSRETTVTSSCLCGAYILEQHRPVEGASIRAMSHTA